jgi:xanthine dehydrogenase accessory factor
MHKIARQMAASLEKGQDVVLATIASQSGSTPRTSGTRMLMLPDKRILGTIGGGIVEARVIEAAADVRKSGRLLRMSFDLNRTGQQDDLDVICGGRLTIIMEPILSTPENIALYRDRYLYLRQGVPSMVISSLAGEQQTATQSERCLLTGSRITQGSFSLPDSILQTLTRLSAQQRAPFLADVDGRQFLVDPPFACGTVFIFGAGHVSLQLAKLTGMVNFRTVVLDDREAFANRERFPDADEVIVLENFDSALKGVVIDPDAYIVIVTRGHSHDKTVLAQALATEAGYIGMIGSRAKRNAICSQLEAEGFSRDDIHKVSSPIGIDIQAETPEEIAVSIIAELIQHRAARLR